MPATSLVRPSGWRQYRNAGLTTLGALLAITGSMIGVLLGPGSEITAALFAPGATYLANARQAFWAWWAIIAALVVFVGWQWLPTQRRSQRLATIGRPALIAGAAQLGWVLAGRAGLVVFTVMALIADLVALCLVVWRLTKYPARWWQRLATDTGWGLTLGFVSVQLLMTVGVVVTGYGFADDDLHYLIAIAAYCVFIAGALGLAGRLYHQFAVGIGLLWGFGWLGWARLTGEPRSYLLGALAGFGCFIIVAAFYASGRRRRRHIDVLNQS